jgi:hypothetical protein
VDNLLVKPPPPDPELIMKLLGDRHGTDTVGLRIFLSRGLSLQRS